MNIVEFAKTIGVSKGTVWRALNDQQDISPQTREMVIQKMRELGYQPNRAASSLVTGRSKLISLVMPELTTSYDMMIVRALQQFIKGKGYDLVIRDIGPRSGWDLQFEWFLQWPMDGIIILDSWEWTDKLRNHPVFASTGIVAVGAFVEQKGDCVQIELGQSVSEAINYLLEIGYRRIAYVIPSGYEHDPRHSAYMRVMHEAGLASECIYSEEHSRRAAYVAMSERLTQSPAPDAIFCFNDSVAMGAYRAIYEKGLSIPGNIGVLGCDGIEETAYMTPPLTTLEQPVNEMCTLAWDFLLHRINEPETPPQQVKLHPKLVVRASTRPTN